MLIVFMNATTKESLQSTLLSRKPFLFHQQQIFRLKSKVFVQQLLKIFVFDTRWSKGNSDFRRIRDNIIGIIYGNFRDVIFFRYDTKCNAIHDGHVCVLGSGPACVGQESPPSTLFRRSEKSQAELYQTQPNYISHTTEVNGILRLTEILE